MTKLTKYALLSILFVMCFTTLFAQDNPFVGKWELSGVPENAGIKLYKVFNDKGEFYNMRVIKDASFKTHNGTYTIKDKSVYLELVAPKTEEVMSHVAGQTTTIHYEFSEDKKILTLKGLAVNGNSDWHEVWKKVIDKPLAR